MLNIPPRFLPVYSTLFHILASFLCSSDVRGDFPATRFDLGTLTLSSLKLLGDAHLNNNTIKLTRELSVPTSTAGKALYGKPVKFRHPETQSPASFSTYFSFSVTNLNPTSIGGGFAFVIAPDGEYIGSAGGFLGLTGESGSGSGFVAVEFDTLMDVQFKDVNGNHVGLDLNAVVSAAVSDLGNVDIDLKSGNAVNSWITYDGSGRILTVYVSYSNVKPKSPVLSVPLDLDRYVSDSMFVGFSGSTQGSTEIHSIDWWSFAYVWKVLVYHLRVFGFVALFAHLFYPVVKQPVMCIVLSTMIGFGLVMSGTTAISEYMKWRRTHTQAAPSTQVGPPPSQTAE
ncbi:unnamed protein product [Microthlaspi erraticum]|uniref:Legume lectin domain-containing protein n=1 Tax=Microthlaspi erraticum TaxID=1685480 RepID=A0A6D2L0M2_9BRAS|nr:unnamed protein product [Microthlaspi erraticum]